MPEVAVAQQAALTLHRDPAGFGGTLWLGKGIFETQLPWAEANLVSLRTSWGGVPNGPGEQLRRKLGAREAFEARARTRR